jgi:hypothetical protein
MQMSRVLLKKEMQLTIIRQWRQGDKVRGEMAKTKSIKQDDVYGFLQAG